MTADEQSWTDRARRMIEYHPDARRFMSRAADHFPVKPENIQLLLRLWVESDDLDAVLMPLLSQMNIDLMDNQAELETERSVSSRPSPFGALDESAAEEVIYECIWSLSLHSGLGVSIRFLVSEEGIFEVRAVGRVSGFQQRIGYPIAHEPLQDALVSVYVAEATSI